MHRANNVVIMQTKQLGWIEALEEELHSSKAKMEELERKMEEQDRVIANLMGDNLDHLQDNMCLTTHINSSQERMSQLEYQLGQVGSVLMGMIKGVIEREGLTEMSSHRKPGHRMLLAAIQATRVGTQSTWTLVHLRRRI